MEIEKVYPTQSTFWKFILFSKCTWYWLGSSMKYSFNVGSRRGWAGLSRVHVTSVRRGMDIVTRRELESSQLPCCFVTLVWQYRQCVTLVWQCVTVSVTVQHLIQDNDHNLMMLAAGWWQATALSWGQCYGRYSVSELKQENRTTADCSVTIPLPGAAVVLDQSEFITGVPFT